MKLKIWPKQVSNLRPSMALLARRSNRANRPVWEKGNSLDIIFIFKPIGLMMPRRRSRNMQRNRIPHTHEEISRFIYAAWSEDYCISRACQPRSESREKRQPLPRLLSLFFFRLARCSYVATVCGFV